MSKQFKPGTKTCFASDSSTCGFSVVFEEDDETAYFYAYDRTMKKDRILDALHIYNIQNVVDRDKQSELDILWSIDGKRALLIINDYPHALFDFESHCGYSRTTFPSPSNGWQHLPWNDELKVEFLNGAG